MLRRCCALAVELRASTHPNHCLLFDFSLISKPTSNSSPSTWIELSLGGGWVVLMFGWWWWIVEMCFTPSNKKASGTHEWQQLLEYVSREYSRSLQREPFDLI
jgi:hypothetical protein